MTFGEKVVSLNGELRALKSKLDEKEAELRHANDQNTMSRDEKVWYSGRDAIVVLLYIIVIVLFK